MKGAWLILLLCLFTLSASAVGAAKKEVDRPCFVSATSAKIEISKITLTDERTRLDAVMYGAPGDLAIISAQTHLRVGGSAYALLEAEHVSVGGFTEPESMPENGRLHVCLFFAPLPSGVHAVDFIDADDGWCIYGLQLTGIEPYVFIPDFLKTLPERTPSPVDGGKINIGKSIINGYLLGYDPSDKVDATFRLADWLTYNGTIRPLKIHPDGTFHIETELLLPTCARLQLGAATLDVLLQPGKELTLHIHLPRFSMSCSHVLSHKMGKKPYVWFDGEYVPCRCDYVSPQSQLEGKQGEPWDDIRVARAAYLSMKDNPKQDGGLASIVSTDVRGYVKRRVVAAAEEARLAKAVDGYVVAEVDTALQGKELLSALVSPCRGQAVLVDCWATWCAPCLKSMQAVGQLKKRLLRSNIAYVYVTGATSPEQRWVAMLPSIKGIHYRLTAAQWNSLCRAYAIKGIPAYLVFDTESRLRKTFIGFPGINTLSEELLRAAE